MKGFVSVFVLLALSWGGGAVAQAQAGDAASSAPAGALVGANLPEVSVSTTGSAASTPVSADAAWAALVEENAGEAEPQDLLDCFLRCSLLCPRAVSPPLVAACYIACTAVCEANSQ